MPGGWPFRRSDLMPTYKRAQNVCQLGPPGHDVGAWNGPDAEPLSFPGSRLKTVISQFVASNVFTHRYRDGGGSLTLDETVIRDEALLNMCAVVGVCRKGSGSSAEQSLKALYAMRREALPRDVIDCCEQAPDPDSRVVLSHGTHPSNDRSVPALDRPGWFSEASLARRPSPDGNDACTRS